MLNYAKPLLALGCLCALATGCEHRREDGRSEPPAQTLEQGLKQAGQALERGADKAGEALQRGVDKARPEVEHGVDKLGRLVEQGAAKAGPALERGVKKLGQAVEQGVQKTGDVLAEPSEKPQAEARFDSVPGTDLDGTAQFYQTDGKVRIEVSIDGAPPGAHGIYIHERGDCSDIKGKSMGSHFDPEHHHRGLPRAASHHLGDLGNIEVGDDGRAKLEIAVPAGSLGKDEKSSFVGKAIVIDASKDRGRGNSGEPIACGVIKAT